LSEGSRFLGGEGSVHEALKRITSRLDELGVAYSIAGGMALFRHGFRRFTEDIDLLVTPEGLATIHARLDGLGYARAFAGAKNLRDAELGVKVEFLVTGQYPGDGKPKPVAFPDPSAASVTLDGRRYLRLPALVELKLASGISAPHRLKDLADVLELIRAAKLPAELETELDPYVREKYRELWAVAQAPEEE
jgi:hypothetical protein